MRRLPMSSDDDLRSSGDWVAGLIPDAVALRALSVAVRGPDTVTLGEPTRFVVVVRNRFPASVAVTLPTARLWGWRVDDVPEADERGYEPPNQERTVAFAGSERKVFEATWDGRVRRSTDEGNVWDDREGACEFTGYLAADGWERRGLYDRKQVEVVRGEDGR